MHATVILIFKMNMDESYEDLLALFVITSGILVLKMFSTNVELNT